MAEAVVNQDTPYDAPGAGKALPLTARLLKLAFDFDTLVVRGVPRTQALAHLKSHAGAYDPELLAALAAVVGASEQPQEREVGVGELAAGMLLAEDLYSDAGMLLLSRESPITETLRWRLENTAARGQAPKRIRVLVPAAG